MKAIKKLMLGIVFGVIVMGSSSYAQEMSDSVKMKNAEEEKIAEKKEKDDKKVEKKSEELIKAEKKSEKKFRSKFLTLEIERGENRKPDQFYFEKRFQKMDVVG